MDRRIEKSFLFSAFFHFIPTVLQSFFHLWVTCYDNIMSSYYRVTMIISDTEFGFFDFPLSKVFPKVCQWSCNINSTSLRALSKSCVGYLRPLKDFAKRPYDPKRLLVIVTLRTYCHNKWHWIRIFSSFRYGKYYQMLALEL